MKLGRSGDLVVTHRRRIRPVVRVPFRPLDNTALRLAYLVDAMRESLSACFAGWIRSSVCDDIARFDGRRRHRSYRNHVARAERRFHALKEDHVAVRTPPRAMGVRRFQ